MRTSLAVIFTLFVVSPTSAGWNAVAVDTDVVPKLRDASVEIATDPSGVPGIALGGARLSYMRYDPVGGSWSVEHVDDCPGDVFGLAFAADERPVIGYVVGDVVRIASWSPAGWDLRDVTVAPRAEPSLALDADGHAAVAITFSWQGSGPGLLYAGWNGAGWDVEVLDDRRGVSGPNRVGFDTAGNPRILYNRQQSLESGILQAARDGGGWTRTWLKQPWPGAWYVAVESAHHPVHGFRYVYYHSPSDLDPFERFLDWAPLPDDHHNVEPAYDRDGNRRHYIYTSDPVDADRLILSGGGAPGLVASGGLIEAPSLAYLADDSPVVAFVFERRQLVYAHTDGASWQLDVVFEAVEDVGYGTSIALAPDGEPAVSYLDATNGDVLFATSSGGAWSTETVAGSASVGVTSLAYDEVSGEPAIAYLSSAASSDLVVARRVGPAWVSDTVATGVSAQSLVAAPGGGLAVAYATPSGPIELASWDGSAWTSETVDTFGAEPSLAFDPAGLPAVSFKGSGDGLQLARKLGPSWTTEQVSALEVSSPQLGFAPSGEAHIVFVDHSARLDVFVRHAWFKGGGWSIAELGQIQTSLRYDVWVYGIGIRSDGNPTALYGGRETARYGTFDGTSWTTELVDPLSREADMVLTADDRPKASYRSEACGRDVGLFVSGLAGRGAVRRGRVAGLAPGWKPASLPLSAANEDQTAPFPIEVTIPGTARDDAPPAVDLVLYRALWIGDRPGRNHLKLVHRAGRIDLVFE